MVNETESNPRDIFLQTLDKEKQQYFRELDVMSDVIAEAMQKIDNDPNVSSKELEKILDKDRLTVLKPEQRATLDTALESFNERRFIISKYYTEYHDKPAELFERVFGFKPEGHVEMRCNPWSLAFVLDVKDAKQIGNFDQVGGHYPFKGAGVIKIEELDGKVVYVGREAVERSDTTQREIVKKRSDTDIEETITHEASHAFWHDFLMERKEQSISHRISLDWHDKISTTGFANLPETERTKIRDFVVQYSLNQALDGYLAGALHREKFVREYGPYGTSSALTRTLRDDPDFLKAFEPIHRKRFFILHDVLKEVEHKIDRKKLEALLYVLPPDRIERLLYFVNVDPKEWLKRWEKDNSDEKLKARESRERIMEDDFGGM